MGLTTIRKGGGAMQNGNISMWYSNVQLCVYLKNGTQKDYSLGQDSRIDCDFPLSNIQRIALSYGVFAPNREQVARKTFSSVSFSTSETANEITLHFN